MILLILNSHMKIKNASTFKFQYDSINTYYDLHISSGIPSLNSNMILLIRLNALRTLASWKYFKFQYDSINTRVQRHL